MRRFNQFGLKRLLTSGVLILSACGEPVTEPNAETNTDVLPAAGMETTAHSSAKHKMGAYLGAKSTEYPDWFKESFLDFHEDIQAADEENKRVLLLFHQDNCPYCSELVEKNLSQKNIEDQLKKQFEVIALNLWGDREIVTVQDETLTEKQFAEALKVQFTPTLLFLNEKGQTALRLNGYLPPDKFKSALDFISGKHEKNQSFREYMANNRSQSGAKKLNAKSYFSASPHDLSANKVDRPIAVFFEQTQCPLCDTLHNEVLLAKGTQEVVEKFQSIQLDMWSDEPVTTPAGEQLTAREWAKALGVHYAPTIVLFDRNGKEVIRSEAFFKSFHTQSLFDYVASNDFQQQSNFQRYISDRAEKIREQGIDVNIWE